VTTHEQQKTFLKVKATFRAANVLKHVAEMREVITLFSLRSHWAGGPLNCVSAGVSAS